MFAALPRAEHPAGLPFLIMDSRGSSTRLLDERGELVPLDVVGRFRGLGLCAFRTELLSPSLLSPGARYTLGVTDERLGLEAVGTFVATAAPVETHHARLTLSLSRVDHEPVSGSGGCSDASLDGRILVATLWIQIASDPPLPLWLTASAPDSELGSLEDATWTYGPDRSAERFTVQSSADLSFPILEGADGCLTLRVLDARASVLVERAVCLPQGSSPVTMEEEADATLTGLEPQAATSEASQGAGCAFAARRGRSGQNAWFLLVAFGSLSGLRNRARSGARRMKSSRVGPTLGAFALALVGCSGRAQTGTSPAGEIDWTVSCSDGRADCNGSAQDGCEVELGRDGEHCGACGNDCGGGPCLSGSCGAPSDTLTSGDGVSDLVSDGVKLYWSGRWGSIESLDLATRSKKILSSAAAWIRGISLDATHLYWTDESGVYRVPKDDGAIVRLADAPDAWGVTVDDYGAYFTRYAIPDGTADGAVLLAPRIGGAPELIASGPATLVAVDAESVYWVDPEASLVRAIRKSGGGARELCSVRGWAGQLIVTAAGLFWTDAGGLQHKAADAGCTTITEAYGPFVIEDRIAYLGRRSELIRFEIDTQRATALAWVRGLSGIALAGDSVYFADFETGVVARVPR